MAPKSPPIQEAQTVSLRHRKRDRLPHRSARPAWLVRRHIFRSARFRPACRISDDYAGYISGRSPIRRGHPVVSSSSKSLSSQPTSVDRHLLREKIRQQTRSAILSNKARMRAVRLMQSEKPLEDAELQRPEIGACEVLVRVA